jgi:hypothetical protein
MVKDFQATIALGMSAILDVAAAVLRLTISAR